MKKIFTILTSGLLIAGVNQTFGQSQKMVFIEEGTQASCPPCAAQNPDFDDLLGSNEETTIVLKYQTWWPGFDQMYLDNEQDVIDRIDYYGINGVPTATMNGVIWDNDCGYWEGAPICLSQSEITAEHAIVSEFTMNISAEILNGQLNVTGTVTADQAISGDLRLRLVLAEKQITFEDAPGGTNGETEYNHVMKKFITSTDGITLSASWNVGDEYLINESIPVGDIVIYHFDQLEVIGFIQNDNDKEVHQAAIDRDIEISTTYSNNGAAVEISGLPSSVCSGNQSVSPVFTLQNGGNENLVSADIEYSINGGTPQTYAWTGSISTLGTADVTLPSISFTAVAGVASGLSITVSNPNGLVDEDATDNTASSAIEASGTTDFTAEVTIITDAYGDETYWEIRDAVNTVIASGGNAAVGLDNIGNGSGAAPSDPGAYDPDDTIIEEVTLSTLGCYTYHVTDYYGDGMCCSYGDGSFTVRDNNGDVLFAGGEFTDEDLRSFEGTSVTGLKENVFESKLTVTPNPVVDNVRIGFNLSNSALTTISVTNVLGQIVSKNNLGTLSVGNQNHVIDMSALEAGIYQITVNSGNTTGTKKVTLVK